MRTITVKVHYRFMGSGRDQLTPPAGMWGVDRSTFPDSGVPSNVQAMALIGAVNMGMAVSVWTAKDATDADKAASDAELRKKLVKAAMVLDLDDLSFKLTR